MIAFHALLVLRFYSSNVELKNYGCCELQDYDKSLASTYNNRILRRKSANKDFLPWFKSLFDKLIDESKSVCLFNFN